MSKRYHVLGAGGHARATIGLLLDLKKAVVTFHDAHIFDGETILGVDGTDQEIPKNAEVVLAQGDNAQRKRSFENLKNQISETLIHPTAFVSHSAIVKVGTQIYPKAVVHVLARVEENCIINSGAIIEHEATIGAHSHISVGAVICGRTTIGESCFIGAGAVVKDQLKVCSHVTIGAGAVVVNDIIEPGTYVGVPVKKLTR